MRNFKMIVSYDGTDFFGWQFQPSAITITSALEDSFERTFFKKIDVLGASRTDSGVHAIGQMAAFKTDLGVPSDQIIKAWNNSLPPSILIRNIEETESFMHPCSNVCQKTYLYTIFLSRPLPMVARYGWFYPLIHKVDWERFAKATQLYLGEHDFGSFCKIDDDRDTVRRIDEIKIKKIDRFGVVFVTIKGKSFLRYQIRRMIGYALDFARRKELPVDYIQNLLKNPNPEQILIKADASGLCLRRVVYNEDVCFKRRIF
jgi:tRNA pseudouridine38-40 synthase